MIFTEALNHWGIIYENLEHMAQWPVIINHYVTFRAKVKENKAKQNTGSKGSSLALTVGISAETLI